MANAHLPKPGLCSPAAMEVNCPSTAFKGRPTSTGCASVNPLEATLLNQQKNAPTGPGPMPQATRNWHRVNYILHVCHTVRIEARIVTAKRSENRDNYASSTAFGFAFLLTWLSVFDLLAIQSVPPFYAEATVSVKRFKPDDDKPYASYVKAEVSFYYSNGWWLVEAKTSNPDGSKYSLNCKKIPDGVRYYTLFDGITNGLTVATACPIAFPPPGDRETFLTWLSLCPAPELPLIDARRMRRFLTIPCQPQLLEHQQNVGDYVLNYLQPGSAFLSELSITNNGYSIEYMGYIGPYPAPFENGFTDMKYQVLETTNCNGIVFPMRTIAMFYAEKPTAKTSDDCYVVTAFEVTVKKYNFLDEQSLKPSSAPAQLVANDARPARLPPDKTAAYFVNNDFWRPVSDPEIVQKVRRMNDAQNTKRNKIQDRSVVGVLLILSVVLLPLLIFLTSKKNKLNHNKKHL